MAYQAVFRRCELKYLISQSQKQRILVNMAPYMVLDHFGRTDIRNLYFDTPTYRLIRRSLEKPDYKEKLRLRSYGQVKADDQVFAEVKKKFQGVVYKRRIGLPLHEALGWLCHRQCPRSEGQIAREIDYFLDYYGPLQPTVFLSYTREAYYCRSGGDFRLTFDDSIRCRLDDLSLESGTQGTSILPEGMVLMELKCPGAIPLWMVDILSRERIYKTSYSKYGTAYTTLIFPNEKELFSHDRIHF